jgi:hypothetical protein
VSSRLPADVPVTFESGHQARHHGHHSTAAGEGDHVRGPLAPGEERLIITLGPKEFRPPTAQGQRLADEPRFRQAFVHPRPHLLWRRALYFV